MKVHQLFDSPGIFWIIPERSVNKNYFILPQSNTTPCAGHMGQKCEMNCCRIRATSGIFFHLYTHIYTHGSEKGKGKAGQGRAGQPKNITHTRPPVWGSEGIPYINVFLVLCRFQVEVMFSSHIPHQGDHIHIHHHHHHQVLFFLLSFALRWFCPWFLCWFLVRQT